MNEQLIQGKVARILNSRELAINIGSNNGVQAGMYFDILDPKGENITDPDITIFHAGTKSVSNELVTNGGRVLGVTATWDNLTDAISKAYKSVASISFSGMQFRSDIGKKSI